MIVAGFGFRASASVDSLCDALNLARAHGDDITALATPTDKAETDVFRAFAAQLALPVISIDAARLTTAKTLTQSADSRAAHNTGSVAEAAALIAAGPDALLVQPRVVSTDRMATCAVARATRENGGPT